MPLGKPAQLVDGCLERADALEIIAALEGKPAEDCRADAHGVHRVIGKTQKPGGITAVADSDVEALFLQLADDGAEADHLKIGRFFVAERAVEVRVDSAQVESVHVGIEVQELVHLAGKKAIAPHAGVDLDVRFDFLLALRGDAVEHCRVVLAGDG